MKRVTFFLVAVMAVSCFSGTWEEDRNVDPTDLGVYLDSSGYQIKASNLANEPNEAEIAGVNFDTDYSNISGSNWYSDGLGYYSGADENYDRFLNRASVFKEYGMTISFSDLIPGVEYRFQIVTAWPWGWLKYAIDAPQGESLVFNFGSGDNANALNIGTYEWVADSENAEFFIYSKKNNKPVHAFGYALYSPLNPNQARAPEPADTPLDEEGEVVERVDSYKEIQLSWIAGNDAVSHDVFFGESFEDVDSADTSSPEYVGNFTLGNESLEAAIEPDTTYYWRIDEVNSDSSVSKGIVWTFSSSEVNSYIQDPLAVNWTANSAASMENDPNFIHWDQNEMEYGALAVNYDTSMSPGYALVTRSFAEPLDMTEFTFAYNSMFFLSGSGSDEAPVYVEFEDGSSESAVMEVDFPSYLKWAEARFLNNELTSLGVDVTDIISISIQIGSSENPESGLSGTLYVDDFRVMPPFYAAENFPEDLNQDELLTFADFSWFADNYFAADETVNAVKPSEDPNYLRCWYKFDSASGEQVVDHSGNSADCNNENIIWDTEDSFDESVEGNSSIVFDGSYLLYVWGLTFGELAEPEEATVSMWVKSQQQAPANAGVFRLYVNSTGDNVLRASVPNFGGSLVMNTGTNGYLASHSFDPVDAVGQWHHYAFVQDAVEGTMKIYVDGVLTAEKRGADEPTLLADSNIALVGANSWSDYFTGKMDEFRVYSYALTQEEIVYLAKGETGSVVQPYDMPKSCDFDQDGDVDSDDLINLSELWPGELLWPVSK
ncbi:LamG domain-containing protein [Sedimentisphaera salicampi]|uniref:LamG-like jellyroll fold domain-containing protein n=1 Tax=Sedimentisphaera salicampi TaxID=1941349 RepID=A0A1W6LNX5_9BACT|nr:LamG domain-containing protein [Sedimentisphaera salicampi]ARN57479.1 hypothetical protein STSP1_01889 [Sedimentisphaera salicampi]